MEMKQIIKRLFLVGALTGSIVYWGYSQNIQIELEEALRVAKTNNADVERARLGVEQSAQLLDAGPLMPPAQLFFSGEEFNFGGQSGVQSLNVQQNFYLPKATKAQRAYYAQNVQLAERNLALTEQELNRQVKHAFYQLQFVKQEQKLATESLRLYEDFRQVAIARQASGESGGIPQLAARARLGKAELELEHANENYQIALTLFNKWLRSDTLYDAAGSLSQVSRSFPDTSMESNLHMRVIQAQIEIAEARVETQQAQLLPQINSGLRLQNAFGTFPLFGYQIGVNVPLFRKSYSQRIEAAKVGVLVQDAAAQAKIHELDRKASELGYRINHQQEIMEYIDLELRPVLEEQQQANQHAFREGVATYLEYLDSLEQLQDMKQQYLNALYQFNALQVELAYWLGN